MRDGPSLVKPVRVGASSDPFIVAAERRFGKSGRGGAGLHS